MNRKLFLLFVTTICTLNSFASLKMPKTFAERSLARIETSALNPFSLSSEQSGKPPISFTTTVQLPGRDLWTSAGQTRRPYDSDTKHLQKMLLFTGIGCVVVALALFIISGAATSVDPNVTETDKSRNLQLAAIAAAVVGGGLMIAAALINAIEGRQNQKGSWY